MHTDIKDLQVSRSLRRLGSVRVTEWEFSDILPKVREIGATEVDVLDLFKRTANIRVNDWEFGSQSGRVTAPTPPIRLAPPSPEEAKDCIGRLSAFLGFATRNLIDNPNQASIKFSMPSPSEIRFRLILSQRDCSTIIGHGGHTAAAIRNLLQDAGSRARFFVELKILSLAEERKLQMTRPSRDQWKQVKV